MDPFTIGALLLLLSGAAAVSLAAIERWIDRNKVPNGTAEIIRRKIDNGTFQVMTGVFDQRGIRIAYRTWEGGQFDSALQDRFRREGDVIRVRT